jgi:hypothetical protein
VSASYLEIVDGAAGVALWVEFTTRRGRMVDYAVVLLLFVPAGVAVIRVYDSAHGYNEMHRYSRDGGKQTGTLFHSGTLSEGMNSAIAEAKRSYGAMIEGWRT